MRQNPNTYFETVDNCWSPTDETDNQSAAYNQNNYSEKDKEPVDILVKMLDEDIIPRLLLSHKAQSSLEQIAEPGLRNTNATEADYLADLVVNGTQESSLDFVKKLTQKQVSTDSIFLDLIPQTARKLGVLWENDICSFADVTVGLWRLQHILYELCNHFQSQDNVPVGNLNALLIPAPNSQHTLGLFIVVEFFRRAGWRVSGEPNLKSDELSNLIFSQWFDVIGISIGYAEQLEKVNELIDTLRARSMNPHVSFMVGGPLYASHPELFDNINAEIKSADANDAIRQAELIVAKHKLNSKS